MAANDEKRETEAEDTQPDEASEPDLSTKKKKKKRAAEETGGPKDRNKRVREQAARKMEEARERAKSRAGRIGATGLDAGEMMDDAMARGFAAFTRWLKNNRRTIEFSVAGLILAGAGYAAWDWYSTKTRQEASTMLMQGTFNDLGVVETEEDKPANPEDAERLKDVDPRPRFESYKEKREAALRAYRATADDHGGTGAGILARLGEAGVLLDREDYDGAIKALEAVLATDLAKADETVRMNAKERMGMALEGKGDEAGALAAYQELAGSTLDYYKNMGLYHQARMAVAKGKKDEAKEKLEKLKERIKGKDSLKSTGGDRYLTTQVDALMRVVDPSAAPLTGGGEITPEKLRELQEQFEKMRKNAPELMETPPPPPKAPASGSAAAPPKAPAPGSAAAPVTPEPENKAPEAPKPQPEKAPAPPASAGGQ